jgi:hypothetical protein
MLCEFGELEVWFDRGVRGLAASRTRCLGVECVEEAKTSLNRMAEGVDRVGGMFSFAGSSTVRRMLALEFAEVSAFFRVSSRTIRFEAALRSVTERRLRTWSCDASSYI